jgi:GT2 family glycosyltransferase
MTSRSVQPRISVVIPNYNGAAFLESCLSSLLRQTYTPIEIVVVDNASVDASVEIILRVAPQAALLREERNLGFAGGTNAGVRAAHGEWIAVLNNDTEVAADWLAECVHAMERHPDAAYLACRILDFNQRDRIYSAGDCFLRAGIGYRRGQDLKDRQDYRQEAEIFAASGCAALYRKCVMDEVNGYDERFFAYLEDVDLALRLQAAGYRGWYIPRAEVYHLAGATSGGEFSRLAVRLRTRNSILLLIKSVPARIFWRCCARIAAVQLSWLARVISHGRVWSYLRGLAGVVPLLSAMLKERRRLRVLWRTSTESLWQAILRSEALARRDFVPPAPEGVSTFLKWYFRLS